jgi:hypothetical protein
MQLKLNWIDSTRCRFHHYYPSFDILYIIQAEEEEDVEFDDTETWGFRTPVKQSSEEVDCHVGDHVGGHVGGQVSLYSEGGEAMHNGQFLCFLVVYFTELNQFSTNCLQIIAK